MVQIARSRLASGQRIQQTWGHAVARIDARAAVASAKLSQSVNVSVLHRMLDCDTRDNMLIQGQNL
jgi:hypothetical protein